jgi:D-lactate dehydrogenase
MNIAFFEVEGWEKPILERSLAGHRVAFYAQPLLPSNADIAGECDVVSVFISSRVDEAVLSHLSCLRLLTTRSTGFDHIDHHQAAKREIAVANVPEYGSNTVAEHTFALLLALSRKVIPAYVRARGGTFSTEGLRGFDLRGKTLGVIGAGNIGLHVIRIARSFSMQVIASDPFPRPTIADILDFRYVPFDQLIRESDIVSLHCPATVDNRHLISSKELAAMKPGAVLINTARGSLVDTHALIDALQRKHLAGAGLDVIDGEAAVKDDAMQTGADREQLISTIDAHRLLHREDVIVTPHNAFNSVEAVGRILESTVDNIQSFIRTGKARFAIAP